VGGYGERALRSPWQAGHHLCIALLAAKPTRPCRDRTRPTPPHTPPHPRYVVQWVSGSKAPQQAQWGSSPKALDKTVASQAVTYTAAQM
jgi:hypothetical protein